MTLNLYNATPSSYLDLQGEDSYVWIGLVQLGAFMDCQSKNRLKISVFLSVLTVLFSRLWSAVPDSTCMLISVQLTARFYFVKNLQSTRDVFAMHLSNITCQSNSLSFSWLPSPCLFSCCGLCSLPWCSLYSPLMPLYCKLDTKSTTLSVQQGKQLQCSPGISNTSVYNISAVEQPSHYPNEEFFS